HGPAHGSAEDERRAKQSGGVTRGLLATIHDQSYARHGERDSCNPCRGKSLRTTDTTEGGHQGGDRGEDQRRAAGPRARYALHEEHLVKTVADEAEGEQCHGVAPGRPAAAHEDHYHGECCGCQHHSGAVERHWYEHCGAELHHREVHTPYE